VSMLRRLALTLSVILVCAPVAPSSASVGQGLTLDELVARSDEIVFARAVASESRFEGGRIVTEIELERVETIRGGDGERLTLVTPGGAVGDVGMRVEGAPRVDVGTEAVLFGRRTAQGVRAVGMSQGVFPVRTREGRPWVHPSGEGIVLLRRDAQGRLARVAPPLAEPMVLDSFLEQVRVRAGRR
jgi:hypothetical protein